MKVLLLLLFLVVSTVFPGVGISRINNVLKPGYTSVPVPVILRVVGFMSSLTSVVLYVLST